MTDGPPLAVVLKGYPRLSETFIAQELEGLERTGLAFEIWSLRHPTDTREHPVHGRITAARRYLPEYLRTAPWRVLRGLASQVGRRGFWRAARVWLGDLIRARDINRVRRFGQAAVLARELPGGTRALYAHFLHTPCSVTRYAAMMRGVPFAVSAHAKDIWTIPDWEKREKLAGAAFCATCTRANTEHLNALVPGSTSLIYHGLDLDALPPVPKRASSPLFRLFSVGRLVEKKGYDTLLDALARLPDHIDWRFAQIGGGEGKEKLRARAEALGLSQRIDWRGAQPRDAVFASMAKADLFVLPSRITEDGDRDGLPNVLMEAASQKLPVLSTTISGIPEFIEDGRSGTLVPPGDPQALADAMARLAANPEQRAAQADALYQTLHSRFDAASGIRTIAGKLRAIL